MRSGIRQLLALIACLGLLAGFAGEASAAKLSKKRATKAAYAVAQKVGAAEGAAYAFAGYCKRRSSRKVICWAAIVWSNRYGAAQRVSVVREGGKVRARRFGKIYRGYVGGRRSGQSGGEWAVCGIRSSVCVGS